MHKKTTDKAVKAVRRNRKIQRKVKQGYFS